MDFKLRPFTMDDVPALVKYANNKKISRFMTDRFPHPYSEEAARKFIEFTLTHAPLQINAIEIDGEAAGGIGIHPQEDVMRINAELGYWLAEPYWRKGVVSRAIPMMIEYAFNNFDIRRIYARPYGNNLASQAVLEKCGFKLEGRFSKTILKDGELLDELIYAIRKEE